MDTDSYCVLMGQTWTVLQIEVLAGFHPFTSLDFTLQLYINCCIKCFTETTFAFHFLASSISAVALLTVTQLMG